MACPTATVEIVQRSLTNSASYTRPVCTTVANRKMKVFKPFLQISRLCQLSLIRICPLTLRKDLPSIISLMLSKIEMTGFDYAETNHTPWMKPYPWPVNLTHFVPWIEIGQEDLQRFALLMKFKVSLICFKLILKCYGLTFKHNNNVRRLSKLFSIQQLSQSMSVNTAGSQQRPPALCYSVEMVYAGIARNFAITVVTAHGASHMNKIISAREMPGGYPPRARGIPE